MGRGGGVGLPGEVGARELGLEKGTLQAQEPLGILKRVRGKPGDKGWRPGRGERGVTPTCKIAVSLLSPAAPPPLSSPPQLLRMFFRQQDEIRRLKEELAQKDIRIRQLQLELRNLLNSPKNC